MIPKVGIILLVGCGGSQLCRQSFIFTTPASAQAYQKEHQKKRGLGEELAKIPPRHGMS